MSEQAKNKKYKKILFDLDNTLIDDDANRSYAIKKILKEKNEEISQERVDEFIKIDNQFWKDRAAGKIKNPYEFKSIEEKTKWVRAQRFLIFFDKMSLEEAINISNRYTEYLREIIVPIENSKEILEYLFNKGYDLYIVTNGPIIPLKDKLKKSNINTYIKYAFSAEEAGRMKPHKEFFDKFFMKANIENKKDILIIGDELEKDVLGGIKKGMDTCWFNKDKQSNNTDINPKFEICNLNELKNIL